MTYLLAHGFGFDNSYWQNLIPILDAEYEFFDRNIDLRKEYIGIGHSLGFLKLNNSGIKFKALICLQGFLNFCGNNSERIENLNRMIELCLKNPKNLLKFFYRLCGYNGKIPKDISAISLIKDLEMMKGSYFHCGARTLVIGSNSDKVVEKNIIENDFKNFAQIKYINDVNHTLGYSRSQEIFEAIHSFLNSQPFIGNASISINFRKKPALPNLSVFE